MTTLVSVVVPVFNRPTRLREAVASILAQPDVTVEVIVVNDGSTDHTAEVADGLARSFGEVEVLHQTNAGPAAARNAGIARAQGTWLTFLDSDDLMPHGRLRAQVAIMERLAAPAGVIGCEAFEIQPGVEFTPRMAWLASQPQPTYYWMSLMTTRAVIDDVGGFDETLWMGEDTELLFRLRRCGVRIEVTEDIWVTRRIFGDNLIFDEDAVARSMARALHRNLPDRALPPRVVAPAHDHGRDG